MENTSKVGKPPPTLFFSLYQAPPFGDAPLSPFQVGLFADLLFICLKIGYHDNLHPVSIPPPPLFAFPIACADDLPRNNIRGKRRWPGASCPHIFSFSPLLFHSRWYLINTLRLAFPWDKPAPGKGEFDRSSREPLFFLPRPMLSR